MFVRTTLLHHATWLVNSATHLWGYRSHDTRDRSTNLWWVALVSLGEGWHNNHHAFPRSAVHGLDRWQLDLSAGLIAWGEGWHNNHHAFQRSARHGHAWWELDMTWHTIRALRAMGLASEIQLPPQGAERFRLDRRAAASVSAESAVPAA